MRREIDLTPRQREVLRGVFARYADRLDRVGVYGSRVQARAKPGSDVDLVVFGSLGERDIGGLLGDLEESDLSIFADVVAYDAVRHPRLRAQIDRWMVPLFDRDELLAARAAQADHA